MDRSNNQGVSMDVHLPPTTQNRGVSVLSNKRAPARYRWGEDKLYIQNKKDNLTCLRNNFDSCHEIHMNQRTMAKEPYMHMIPKPMSVDIVRMSWKGDRHARFNATARMSNRQVFPLLDACRKTKEDKYVLSEETRAAIQQINNKRYCVPSHRTIFGDIYGESNIFSPTPYHREKPEFGTLQKAENYNLPEIIHNNFDHASYNKKLTEQHNGYSKASICYNRPAGDIPRNNLKSKENENNKKFATNSGYGQLHPGSVIGAETLQMALRSDEICRQTSAPNQEGEYCNLLNNSWNTASSMQPNFEKPVVVSPSECKNTSRLKKLAHTCNSVPDTDYKGNLSANSDKNSNRNFNFGEDDCLNKLDQRNNGDFCSGLVLKCNICQQICSKDDRGGLRCTRCPLQEPKHVIMHLNCFNQELFSGTDFVRGTCTKVSSSTNNYSCNDNNNSSFPTPWWGLGYNSGYSLDSTYTGDSNEHCRCGYFDESDEGMKFYGYHGNEKKHACTVSAHSNRVCTLPAHPSKTCLDFSKAIMCDSRQEGPYDGVAARSKVQDSNTLCPRSDNVNVTPLEDAKINITERVQTVPKKTVCFSRDLVKGEQSEDSEVEDMDRLPKYRSRIHDPPFSKTEAQTRFHEECIDPIPDHRDFHIYSKRIKLCGFNTCVFRGYNTRLNTHLFL